MTNTSKCTSTADATTVHYQLPNIIKYPEKGMFSQVLVRTPTCTFTALGLSAGNFINFHESTGNCALHIVHGRAILDLVHDQITLTTGSFLLVPSHCTQGLLATENTALLHCVLHDTVGGVP